MPVVLLDTNVWVSAFINPCGFPARLKDAWVAGRFDVVVSVPLLEEIADVLTRLCRDPDDDLILETAVLGGAQFAVSRDDDLNADNDLIAQMSAHGVSAHGTALARTIRRRRAVGSP